MAPFVARLLVLLVGVASGAAIAFVGMYGWHGDSNPNPVGFGVLMVLATPAGVAMVGAGLSRGRKAARQMNG